jgi:hypothetical protein
LRNDHDRLDRLIGLDGNNLDRISGAGSFGSNRQQVDRLGDRFGSTVNRLVV